MKKRLVLAVTIVVGAVVISALVSWIRKRDAAVTATCVNMLLQIDGAKEQWAFETHKGNGAQVTWDDIRDYFKGLRNGEHPWGDCPGGGRQTIGAIGQLPSCSIKKHQAAFEAQFSGRLFAPLPRGLLDREGIQALSACPELSTLVLSGHGELRPGVLPAIAELPHLRRLQMFETLIPLEEEPILARLSHRIEVTVTNTAYSTKLRRAAGGNP